MVAIRIEGLRKKFGRVQALDGLSLTVETGSVFGFLGPNGAGKTTTIRILSGLAHADAGRAWVDGVEVTSDRHLPGSRAGYLPQEPAFYPWMSAREFLDHVGRVFGLPASERAERTQNLLNQVGLEEAADRRTGGFSGGMRQRLGIAQALVNRPPVLLLDEPVSGLDPFGRSELLKLIEELRGQCSIFMSTHILADVERVADTVAIINRGRLVAVAPQRELIERYAIPAFEIEVQEGRKDHFAAWVESLRPRPWVTALSVGGNSARVVVNDVETARRELLAAVADSELALNRFEAVRPSLEEVFLRLVEESGAE